MVTSEQLRQLHIEPSLADAFNETFERFGIVTPAQQASWIGQCGHECGNFRIMEENLNYRAPTLLKLFPQTPKRAWGYVIGKRLSSLNRHLYSDASNTL